MVGHAYSHKGVMSNDPRLEDKVPEGRNDYGACQTVETELPCLFSFACACVHACHKEDDV
jgi:hypothetical protein